VATTSGLMTFAEFEKLPDIPGYRFELRHGELVKVGYPVHEHYLIQRRLRRVMERPAGDHGIVDIELAFRALPEHEYRVADVAFVSRERWEKIPRNGCLAGAPEIVIEVLSPSNTATEILDKEKLWLENGAREFWVVDPDHRQIKISTPDGRTVTCRSGDEIPLSFGGTLAVDSVFD